MLSTLSIDYDTNSTRSYLKRLILSKNNFTGTIPSTLGLLDGLMEIALDDNMFSGTIPSEISKIRSLELLILSRNHLSGTIPDSIFKLENLTLIDIASNFMDIYEEVCGLKSDSLAIRAAYSDYIECTCCETQCDGLSTGSLNSGVSCGAVSKAQSTLTNDARNYTAIARIVEDACRVEALRTNSTICHEACNPYFSTCIEWENVNSTSSSMDADCDADSWIPEATVYSKCHSLDNITPPSASTLLEHCSIEQLEIDSTACYELCQAAECCNQSQEGNCLLDKFVTCLDYAPCHNLHSRESQRDLLPVAPRSLASKCSEEDSKECSDACLQASTCCNPVDIGTSRCLMHNLISCATYTPYCPTVDSATLEETLANYTLATYLFSASDPLLPLQTEIIDFVSTLTDEPTSPPLALEPSSSSSNQTRKCHSPAAQVGMMIQSSFIELPGQGGNCSLLCEADPSCQSWMTVETTDSTCVLSADADLSPMVNQTGMEDTINHAYTYNTMNCDNANPAPSLSPSASPPKCNSAEQPGMTLQSAYLDHTNGGAGNGGNCADLCAADPQCQSWMWRNTGNSCYLSADAELMVHSEGCCGDHHPFTYNAENCELRRRSQ